jgi:hypothetical protein
MPRQPPKVSNSYQSLLVSPSKAAPMSNAHRRHTGGRSEEEDRRAVGRLSLPVHDRRTGGERAAKPSSPAHRCEQLLPRLGPASAARLPYEFRAEPGLREHRRASQPWRRRGRPWPRLCRGGGRVRLQGDNDEDEERIHGGVRPRSRFARRSRQPAAFLSIDREYGGEG